MAAEYVVPRYFHPTSETKLTTQDIIAAIGQQPYYFRQTTSGNYLAGQFAQRHKDWNKAAEYINRVSKHEEANPDLQKSSMVLSMAAGNAQDAIMLAKEVLKNNPDDILAILFTALDHLKKEDYAGTIKIFDQIKKADIAAFIIPVLRLWAEAGQNKFSTEGLHKNSFYAYQILLIGAHLDKKDQALSFAKKSFKIEENDVRDLEKYGDAFLVFGEIDKALEIYKAIEAKNYATDSIKDKIINLEKTKPFNKEVTLPVINSPQDGVALVFQDMAEILLREYSDDSAAIFSQMALYLNPKLYKNHAIISEVYSRNGRFDAAIKALQNIDRESDLYSETQRLIADLYSRQEKDKEAIKILQNLYQNNDDIDALIQIGDIYRYQEDYARANETYTQVLNKWDEVPEKYWHVYYGRGMALERLKEFKAAEDDLQKALEFRPDNPYLLNYLGYSWVDQGINLDESLKMISRAAAYKPNDGYIIDSLGWAFYKQGEYKASILPLERAVKLLPYDATINDHLGNAYWQVNRKNEAKFQWQRALNYNEDEDIELKEKIEHKLIYGLPKEAPKKKISINEPSTKKEL